VEEFASAATEVVAPEGRPHRSRPAGLAAESLRHPRHTEGLAREVRTDDRSSALRTGSCANTNRQERAPRRSRRERSATPFRHRGSNRSACWVCAGQALGRRKRVQQRAQPSQQRLLLQVTGALSASFGSTPRSATFRIVRRSANRPVVIGQIDPAMGPQRRVDPSRFCLAVDKVRVCAAGDSARAVTSRNTRAHNAWTITPRTNSPSSSDAISAGTTRGSIALSSR